ncbi:hypothetical protein [Pseudomonas fulva]|uniref:hypothetical protein n=1 Tax=Pseudomonas fulva TaxID=47880 RepID=UPI003AF32688
MVIAFQFLQFGGQAGGAGADGLEGCQVVGVECIHLLLQLFDASERIGLTSDGRPANLGGLLQLGDSCRLGFVLETLIVQIANSGQGQNTQHDLGCGHIHTGITSRT